MYPDLRGNGVQKKHIVSIRILLNREAWIEVADKIA